MTVAHSTTRLPDRPLSRAGSLLQVRSGLFCVHASGYYIQHIATIAQGDAAQQCEVAEDHRVGADFTSHREAFKDLRHSADSVAGRAEQRVQGLGGVDVEGGEVVGVAG